MNSNETIDFDSIYDYIISLIPDEMDISEIISYNPEINNKIPNHLPPIPDKSGRLAEKYGYSTPKAEDLRQEIYKAKKISLIEGFVLNSITDSLWRLSLYCTKIRKNEIRKSTVLNKVVQTMKSSLAEKAHRSGYSTVERKTLRKFVSKYS